MGIKKFINSVIELLEVDKWEKTGKKKSVKRLLEKLKIRKEILNTVPKKKLAKKEKKELKELKEELEIITFQIKKGEKILNELNSQESKNSKNKKEK
jgi:soluble cytochrome b562